MPYVHRNAGNEITGLTRWPNGSSEELPEDHPEVVAFLNPPTVDAGAELDAAIAAATTLEELKAALLGTSGRSGKVAGRPA